MATIGRYDTELSMFVEEPHSANLHYLTFLRWLRERGTIGYLPIFPPSGPHAPDPPKPAPVGGD
jgi:hypothetical protein